MRARRNGILRQWHHGSAQGPGCIWRYGAVKRVGGTIVSQLPCSNRDLSAGGGGIGSWRGSRPPSGAGAAAIDYPLETRALNNANPSGQRGRHAQARRDLPALPHLAGRSPCAAGPMERRNAPRRWNSSWRATARGSEAYFCTCAPSGGRALAATHQVCSSPHCPRCPRSPQPDRPEHFVTVHGCIALLLLRLTSQRARSPDATIQCRVSRVAPTRCY